MQRRLGSDRLRGSRRAGAQGQDRTGAGLARPARRRRPRWPQPRRGPGTALRRARAGAAPAQGPAASASATSSARASSPSPGPAGIGKSRLAWEFEKYLDGLVEDVYWHRGRAPSYGEGVTFWALGEMVRKRAGLLETDDDETTRARICTRPSPSGSPTQKDREWVEPALLTLLGPRAATGRRARDALRGLAHLLRARRRAGARPCCSSRTCSGPTAASSTSSTTSWSGPRACPCWWSRLARPELLERRPGWGTSARSFNAIGLEPLTDDQHARAAHGTRARDAGRRRRVHPRACRRHPALRGRDRAHAGRRRSPVRRRATVPSAPPATSASWPSPTRCGRSWPRGSTASTTPIATLLQDAAVLGKTFATGRAGRHLRPGRSRAGATPARAGQAGAARDLGGPALRRSGASTASCSRSSARSPTTRSHAATAALGTWLRRATSKASATTSWRACSRRTTWPRIEASEPGPEADALRIQARLALRGAAERAMDLGAADQALALLRTGAGDHRRGAPNGRTCWSEPPYAADIEGRYEEAERLGFEAVAAYEEAGDRTGAGAHVGAAWAASSSMPPS